MSSNLRIQKERFDEELRLHNQVRSDEKITDKDGNERKPQLWVQRDIASILGISESRMSLIAGGKVPVKKAYLDILAKIWGCSPEWLCGLSNERTAEEAKRKEISSKFRAGFDKIFTEINYMTYLGVNLDLSSVPDNVRVSLPSSSSQNDESPHFVSLSLAQFKTLREEMNLAAAGAIRSCLKMLMAADEDGQNDDAKIEEILNDDFYNYYLGNHLLSVVPEMIATEDPEEFQNNINRLREPFQSFIKDTFPDDSENDES